MKESKKESALRILIVEDNEHDRIAFRRAFQKSKIPCVITEYEKAEDALLKIGIDGGSSFDIIVSDHGLPGISGLDLLKEVIKKGLQIPLVLLTGSGTEEIAIEALKAGIDDYIIKDDLKGYLGLLPLTIAAVLKNYNEKRLRIKAEKDTNEWKNRYEAAARTSGHILYDWDSNTNDVTYGGDLERILGYTAEEIKGGLSRWKELIHPDDRERFNEAIDHIKKTKDPANFQYRVLKKDGNYIYMEDRGDFITDTEGNVIRMVGFVEDITARKRAEEEIITAKKAAEKANMLKTQFIAIINHELRGPLQSIVGYLKLVLENKYDSREEETDFLNSAYTSSIHLKGLISDLLDISLIESDKIRLTFKSVSLPAVFTHVRSITSMLAKEKKLELDINSPCFETGQEVYCDPERLKQALVNLVGNAIKFTEKGSVSVYCEPGSEKGTVKINVKDTGIGIDPGGPDLFEPFVQMYGAKFGGTGLGLSIAKKLIEKMNGTLEVSSGGIGMGTTISITLPESSANIDS